MQNKILRRKYQSTRQSSSHRLHGSRKWRLCQHLWDPVDTDVENQPLRICSTDITNLQINIEGVRVFVVSGPFWSDCGRSEACYYSIRDNRSCFLRNNIYFSGSNGFLPIAYSDSFFAYVRGRLTMPQCGSKLLCWYCHQYRLPRRHWKIPAHI